MAIVQQFDIPGLALVNLDARDNEHPLLEIRLDPAYGGDLNDIARQTAGPDDLYLACNEETAGNNAQLAKFLEVLTHFDSDGDDVPDYQVVIDAIEAALFKTKDSPALFVRPGGDWYTRLVMRIMPPAPRLHIVMGFGKLNPRFRWYHHVGALPMLLAVLVLINLQIKYLPIMKYSVVSAFTAGAEALGLYSWVGLVAFWIVLFYMLTRNRPTSTVSSISKHTYGFFNKAAVYEEQAFREGSESWNMQQRVRSCLAFGAIHMVNLFYPLATILPLAVAGGFFMFIYLRTYRKVSPQHSIVFRRAAVLESSLWHRVYNRMALIAVVLTLLVYFGSLVIGFVVATFAVLVFSSLWFYIIAARQIDDEPEVAEVM
jgi:hypothetical protein